MLSELLILQSLRRVYSMSPEQLRELQNRKLREAVAYAYQRVPLLRERFEEAGVRPEEIRATGDLARLPVTTKADYQTPDARRVIADGVDPEACTLRRTSGSTGRPLRIFITREDQRMRSLVELRSLMRLGLRMRDRSVVVGPETRRKRRLHERLGFYANERVSGNIPPEEQLRRLRELKPTVLWFYPTQLRALMRAAGGRLRDHIQPRMLISSAEMLDDLLRTQVQEDLGLNPHSAYGTNEIGRIAMECPAREGLHINVDHVVLEAWEDGKRAAPGETGTVLATTLNAKGMPLLRYRLGDRIRLLEEPCSCGSPLPLMAPPHGRENDVITLPSGRLISVWTLSVLLREHLDILQFRIVQQTPDRIEIQLVTREPWPVERLRQTERRALERLGEAVTVQTRMVEELPPEGAKFRYFVSHVPR